MKDIFSRDNILIQAASDDEGSDKKKGKKGDGINAILVLLRDVRDFQEKLETCIEAQDLEDITKKIRSFDTHMDEMYAVLLDIASGGIKSIRQKREPGQAPSASPAPSGKSPLMMGVPTVPKIS